MQNAAHDNPGSGRLISAEKIGEADLSFEHTGLYKRIALAILKCANSSQLREVGNSLTNLAEQALALRHEETLELISRILINSSFPRQYRRIGEYYQAISILRRGEPIRARAILETLAASENTPIKYRAKAIKDIGSIYYESSNYKEAVHFYLQALHAASPQYGRDLDTVTTTQWGIAIIKSIQGDNKGALATLEGLSSSVRLLASKHPSFFYSYANSLAVEYGELGRIEEAQNALSIAFSSPFTHQLPEIRNTAEEIRQKARRASHSRVALSAIPVDFDKLVEDELANSSVVSIGRDFFDTEMISAEPLGVRDTGSDETAPSHPPAFKEPASLLPFPNLFADLADAGQRSPSSQINILHFFRMSVGQKRSLVMDVARDPNTSAEILDKMLEIAGVVRLGEDERPAYKTRTINLKHRGFLEALIRLWVQGEVSPEEFVAVLSAIRDCTDTFRRNNILDQMISYSFHASSQQIKSEEMWRNLPEVQPQDLLEDEAYLEDKISLWINGEMTAEDLASVLIAVRDCTDDQRRNHLLNRMIRYAYLQIANPLESEREWRRRVEASLESLP
jgi:tetratricopeptide (TPR) repeat protein